ncbi:hypothetical protein GCM10022403_087410 [Streptomyces coacervatus]|uniref:Uncharacterized protein n=1 Tax=Streptomyces coacervatus TaxID=647381 RepID=A0ABP7JCZ6_9ACTN
MARFGRLECPGPWGVRADCGEDVVGRPGRKSVLSIDPGLRANSGEAPVSRPANKPGLISNPSLRTNTSETQVSRPANKPGLISNPGLRTNTSEAPVTRPAEKAVLIGRPRCGAGSVRRCRRVPVLAGGWGGAGGVGREPGLGPGGTVRVCRWVGTRPGRQR